MKLGNPNGAHALRGKQTGNAEAVAKIKEKAAQRAMDLRGTIDGIKRSGITSVRAISEELNRQGMWLVLRSARRQRTPTRAYPTCKTNRSQICHSSVSSSSSTGQLRFPDRSGHGK